MKLHLPLMLLAPLVASFGSTAYAEESTKAPAPTSELGNVMYVGDSITHGVNSASWRWAMHKLLVDNGITYTPVGYKTGNFSGGVGASSTYGGVIFDNVHSSQASARAWEIAGRKAGGRFDNTNLQNWLGQSTTKTGGGAYTGSTYDVDTFYLLIGTNDLLSDIGALTTAANLEAKTTNLLGAADANGVRSGGDMKTILDSMYAEKADAPVTILSIPCWTRHANSNSATEHAAVQSYNVELEKWVKNYNSTNNKNALYVDVNKGMVDVASSTPFYGCESMFGAPGSDGLHPSPQGDLLMAGAVAKAQGYAGRTAGQERKAAEDFAYQAEQFTLTGDASISENAVTLGSGASAMLSWAEGADLSAGYTVDFSLPSGLGNGATDGWDNSCLSISLGDGTTSGTLNISEAYIKWGDTILYSMDMGGAAGSTAYTVYDRQESIRVAYVNGNAGMNLDSGYYVWLGDMLIGEACTGVTSALTLNGISITNGTGGSVELGSLAAAAHAYAPTTTRYSVANPVYKPSSGQWSETEPTDVTLSNSNADNVRGALAAAEDGVHIRINSGSSTSNVYISNTQWTGDLWAEIDGTTNAGRPSFCGVKQGNALTGNAYFRVDDTYEGTGPWGTWFGALNGGSISGELYMEFSSAAWNTAGNTSYNGNSASVAGAFAAGVGGRIKMVINAGTFRSGIWGGNLSGNYTVGSTDVQILGGTIMNNIHAGSAAGTISRGSSLSFKGENYKLEGVTHISAGGTGGIINGGAALIIDGMDDGSEASRNGYGMAGYTGILSGSHGATVNGGRTLAFKNSVHEQGFGATLQNFDRIIFSKSDITLGSLGGATGLELDPTSTLTLTAGTYEHMSVMSSGTIVIKGADFSITAEGNDSQVSGVYRVESGSLGLENGYITQSSFELGADGSLRLGDNVEIRGAFTMAQGAGLAVTEGARATLSGAISGGINHSGAGTLVLAAGTAEAPLTTLTGISGSNVENTGVLAMQRGTIEGTLINNGTLTLLGSRGQAADLSHLTGRGTVILDAAGSGNITMGTAVTTFSGTVEVDTSAGYWFYFDKSNQPFSADDDGHYASLHLRSSNANPGAGLAMGSSYTHGNALKIGNLISSDAGVAVRGAFNTGSNVKRYLDVHQDADTTFAGKFFYDGNNSVGIIKHGTGDLTLTAANASTANLEIEEGTVTLGGANGAWGGAISVASGATLAYSGGNKTLGGNVSLAKGATLRVKDSTLNVGTDWTLASGANAVVDAGATLAANGMTLADNATLYLQGRLSFASGSALKGSGVVEIGGGTSMPTNAPTLHATEWTGTVRVDGSKITGATNIDIAPWGTANSTIELVGFGAGADSNFYFKDSETVAANLKLTGVGADNVAFRLNNGNSLTTYTFNGDWSGDGKFLYNPSGNVIPTFLFNGDMSAYKGQYEVSSGATLQFGNGGASRVAEGASVSGTGIINGTSSSNVLNVVYKYSNDVEAANAFAGNVNISNAGSGKLTLSGASTGNVTIAGGSVNILGNINGALTATGSGVAVFDESDANVTVGSLMVLNGGTIRVADGIVNATRLLVHNSNANSTSDLLEVSGGVLNVTSTDKSYSETSRMGVIIGHYPGAANPQYTLSVAGGVLNAAECATVVGRDSRGYLRVSAGEANFHTVAVNYGRDKSNMVILSGGRTNLGAGGLKTTNEGAWVEVSGDAVIGTLAEVWASDAALTINATGGFTIDTAVREVHADGASTATGAAGSITLNGALMGSGTLSKDGAGALTLEGSLANYTGDLDVKAGTLVLGRAANNLSGNISLASGAMLTAANERVAVLEGAARATIQGSGAVSVTNEERTYTNADITVDTEGELETAATLSNSKLTVTGGGSVASKVETGSVNSFEAASGDVYVTSEAGQTAEAVVTVSGEHMVSFSGDVKLVENSSALDGVIAAGSADDEQPGTVTVVTLSTFTVGNTAIQGNLTVESKGTLEIASVRTEGEETPILQVTNTLKAAASDISLVETVVTDIQSVVDTLGAEKMTASFVLAKADALDISGLGKIAASVLGLTDSRNVSYTLSTTGGAMLASGYSLFSDPGQELVLTATYVSDVVSVSFDALTDTLILGTSLTAENIAALGEDTLLPLLVGEEMWAAVVASVGGDTNRQVGIQLLANDGTPLDMGGRGVSLNGYVGERNGKYVVASIPEPTSTALGLLALAALAARRRRK